MARTIENASTKDLERLCEIERECFGKEAFTKKQFAQLLRDYNSMSLIAKENGKTVGFIIGMIYIERNEIIGHILTIDVLPQYRRRKIGLELLQEMEKVFKEKAARACHLEVREDNIPALSLYGKNGYKRIGRLKGYYGDADGFFLEKDLTRF